MKVPYRRDILTSEMEKKAVAALRANKRYEGEETAALEKEVTEYVGTKHAVAVATGTASLHLAMTSLNIGPGDEVIVPANIYVSAADCAIYVGARPVFVEPDYRSANIDPSRIEEKISPKTKAIIAGHMYGQACDMDFIMEIADNHNISVVEDACQAFGSKYKGKRVGNIGEIGMFGISGKGITTFGGGGLLTTNNEKIARAVTLDRGLGPRSDGASERNEYMSFNYKMREVEAAIARIALRKLDQWNEQRRKYAKIYSEELADIPGLELPEEVIEGAYHVYLHYEVRTERRDELRKFLEKQGIESFPIYPVNLPHSPCYRRLLGYLGHFPISQRLADRVLFLSVHPNHTEEDINYVVDQIKTFFGN